MLDGAAGEVVVPAGPDIHQGSGNQRIAQTFHAIQAADQVTGQADQLWAEAQTEQVQNQQHHRRRQGATAQGRQALDHGEARPEIEGTEEDRRDVGSQSQIGVVDGVEGDDEGDRQDLGQADNPGIPALVLRRQSVGEDAADPRTQTAYHAQQRPQQYANLRRGQPVAAHEECRVPDDGAIADQSGQGYPDHHVTGSTYTPEYGHAGADIDLALGWGSHTVS